MSRCLGVSAKSRVTIAPYCVTGVFAWLRGVHSFVNCYADTHEIRHPMRSRHCTGVRCSFQVFFFFFCNDTGTDAGSIAPQRPNSARNGGTAAVNVMTVARRDRQAGTCRVWRTTHQEPALTDEIARCPYLINHGHYVWFYTW